MVKDTETKPRRKPRVTDKNLIPNSERTPEELREIAIKGGKASGTARREKRSIRESLKIGLEMIKNNELKKMPEGEQKEILKETGIAALQLFDIAFNKKVKTETKLRAIQEILDRTDGKPIQHNINDNINTEIEPSDIAKKDIKAAIAKAKNI